MTKEKQITSQYSLTKQQLVDARASSEFKEGEDWVRGEGRGPKSAILWTETGLSRLLKSKKIDVALTGNVVGTSSEETKAVESLGEQVKEHLEFCPAIVRQKFANRRLVRCEIRGRSELVHVRDSHFLRLGSIIAAKRRGDRFIAYFKVDGKGRVHG